MAGSRPAMVRRAVSDVVKQLLLPEEVPPGVRTPPPPAPFAARAFLIWERRCRPRPSGRRACAAAPGYDGLAGGGEARIPCHRHACSFKLPLPRARSIPERAPEFSRFQLRLFLPNKEIR